MGLPRGPHRRRNKIASGSADGTVKLWTSNGWRLLATLIQLTPRTDQWLITTPAGYLATSSPGAVQWRATGLKTPPDKLTPLVQNPELVRQAIAGGNVAPPKVRSGEEEGEAEWVWIKK